MGEETGQSIAKGLSKAFEMVNDHLNALAQANTALVNKVADLEARIIELELAIQQPDEGPRGD